MNPLGLVVVAAGLFSIIAGAMDWDWFMNHPKARLVCGICGRGGARIFYVVLGAAFVVLGVLFATGVIADHR
jgi:hypothetical protein